MKTLLALGLILALFLAATLVSAQDTPLPYHPNGGCPSGWVAGAAVMRGPHGWYMTSRAQADVEVTFGYTNGDLTWEYDGSLYEGCIVTEYGATFEWSGDRPIGVERIYIYQIGWEEVTPEPHITHLPR